MQISGKGWMRQKEEIIQLLSRNGHLSPNKEQRVFKAIKKFLGLRDEKGSPGFEASKRGDYATTLKEFYPAAERGNARAQYNLGLMYYKGNGVPQDHKTALKWYTLAAEQGYAPAQHNLGLMYDNGQGVPEDDKTAVKWYTVAAEQGNASAQSNLGVMYEKGRGVPQDSQTAAKWFTLAAEQGYAPAQNTLGVMYGSGQGVPQDYVRAHMWFNFSASTGDEDAIENRDFAAKQMTPSQIEEAQKLARECVAKNYKGS